MGTIAAITAIARDEQTADRAVEAGFAALDKVNTLMSDYTDASEIGRLNKLGAGGGLVVSPETFDVLRAAMSVSEQTGGAFDVTCRPLVQLWKQAGKAGRLPDEEVLRQVGAHVGWRKLRLDPATRMVTWAADGMQLDLGAIAKGFSVDLAIAALKQAGATSGLVDVGGNIMGFGTNREGLPWRTGMRHPFYKDRLMCKLELGDYAVSTSGNYERFFMIDGKRYSHIVDPRTGWPAETAPSVSVIAKDGVTCDAWSTAFSVLTMEEGKALAAQLKDIEVLWVAGTPGDEKIAMTPGFERFMVVSEPSDPR